MDASLQEQFFLVVHDLKKNSAAWPFLDPVDWEAMHLDDYPMVIVQPMDLTTVENKLKENQYNSPEDFWHDIDLIWSNCKTFNSETAEVFRLAIKMESLTQELKRNCEKSLECNPKDILTNNSRVSEGSNAVVKCKTPLVSTPLRDTGLLEKKVSNFVTCLSLLEPTLRIAVIQRLSLSASDCFREELMKDPDHSQSDNPILKINLNVKKLVTDYPNAYKHSYGLMKSLLHFQDKFSV